MTSKADFSAAEWSLLRQGPTLAGIYVSLSDEGGEMREGLSIAECYGDAHERWWGGPKELTLIDELLSEGPELDRDTFGSLAGDDLDAEAVIGAGRERVRESVVMLAAKASPDEVAAYRQFVLALATRVAESHKEGGFLGIGGTRVSEKERRALDELAASLG